MLLWKHINMILWINLTTEKILVSLIHSKCKILTVSLLNLLKWIISVMETTLYQSSYFCTKKIYWWCEEHASLFIWIIRRDIKDLEVISQPDQSNTYSKGQNASTKLLWNAKAVKVFLQIRIKFEFGKFKIETTFPLVV